MSHVLTPKENMMNVFTHQPTQGIPQGLMSPGMKHLSPNGIHERPEGGVDGYDWFGVKWAISKGTLTPDPSIPYLLDDICEWKEKVVFPDLENWDWERAARIDGVAEIDRENKMFFLTCFNGLFERLHTLMGFEEALCALLTDPDEVGAFLDRMVEYKCTLLTKVKEYYNPDVFCFQDDYGTQRGLFFSPEVWRELFKPRLRKIVEHGHGLGIRMELHSCGLIQDIIPDVCEIGFDSLQCMGINDIPRLKKLTGNKMSYGYKPDVQKYFSMFHSGVSLEEIKKEVHEEIMSVAMDGNFYPFYIPMVPELDGLILEEIAACDKEIRVKQGL